MRLSVVDEVERCITQVASSFHRLVLVVGPTRSGKTRVLQEAGRRLTAPLLNVNLLVSERLLGLSPKQRTLHLGKVMEEVVQPSGDTPTLLDNIEILFDPQLQQDPLRLLQMLSRRGALVVAWPGVVDGESLIYAEPGHPEHRRYSRPDALIVRLDGDN